MRQTNLLESVKVESIFQPSDFSGASEVAFAYALKTAPGPGGKSVLVMPAIALAIAFFFSLGMLEVVAVNRVLVFRPVVFAVQKSRPGAGSLAARGRCGERSGPEQQFSLACIST